jgi:hypothetical protein
MDWRRPYMEYLTCKKIFDQTLPPEVERVVTQSHKYFVFTNGMLQRIRKGGKSNQIYIPETQVPRYLAEAHGESGPHLAAIETLKAMATGAYWWPTWENDVCEHLRYSRFCKETWTLEKCPKESQHSSSLRPTPELVWKQPITQRLKSYEELNRIGTYEELGLLTGISLPEF